jgi:polyhydroxyalkanoate synthase
VFVISWVNPDAGLRDKTFADYMTEGVLAALDAIERATGERSVNAIGYCIGGTLMAATLAWMAAKRDRRIASCTFFAAQVDFSEAGELQVFTDEAQVAAIEAHAAKQGYLDGEYMATTFNLLRANDLVWSFVVHNYLLGRAPVPFDLLYWNADATRLPAAMLSFYLRRMYLANALVEPDGIALAGVPIDLRRVAVPVYIQASKEDHIAPFRSVYKAMHLFAGTKRFVLAGSGHIAGVINPPAAGKYQHWTYKGRRRFASADDWLAAATETAGSWWPDWERWLKMRSGARVAARSPGAGGLTALADAPGTYVKVRA